MDQVTIVTSRGQNMIDHDGNCNNNNQLLERAEGEVMAIKKIMGGVAVQWQC